MFAVPGCASMQLEIVFFKTSSPLVFSHSLGERILVFSVGYIFEGIPKIGLFTLCDVSIIPWMIGGLSSLRSCDKELLPARPQ